MSQYTMYLDDLRNPKGQFDVVARSYREAIMYFELHGCPNFISFDHDLGIDETGYDLVKYMVNLDLDVGGLFIPKDFRFFVHSANPVGAANINQYLKDYLGVRNGR